jgi:hypothetical protein
MSVLVNVITVLVMTNKKHIAAIVAVALYFKERETEKIAWSDYRAVGWMNKPRNI